MLGSRSCRHSRNVTGKHKPSKDSSERGARHTTEVGDHATAKSFFKMHKMKFKSAVTYIANNQATHTPHILHQKLGGEKRKPNWQMKNLHCSTKRKNKIKDLKDWKTTLKLRYKTSHEKEQD